MIAPFPTLAGGPDMMAQFNKYMEMSKDGMWEKLPSYRNILDHKPVRVKQEHEEKMNEIRIKVHPALQAS